MPDLCPARECGVQPKAWLPMCNRHWFMNPPSLRAEICTSPEPEPLIRQAVGIAAVREAALAELAVPRSANGLLKKLDGWSHVATVVGGGWREISKPGLVNNRPGRVLVEVPVDSVSVRAWNHADGRFVVACWIRREDDGKWKFDGAWRRWHNQERSGLVIELNSSQVSTYVTNPALESEAA